MHALFPGISLVLTATCFFLAATVATGSTGQRALAFLVGTAGVLAPAFVTGDRMALRALATMLGVLGFFRTLDLARERPSRPFWSRLWHVVSLFDTRLVKRIPPDRSPRFAFLSLAGYAVGFAGWELAFAVAPRLTGGPYWTARWLGGAVLLAGTAEGMSAAILSGYRAFGFDVPPFMRAPILSTSLGEFWNVRWNRPTAEILGRHAFRPLARRGHALAGLFATFLLSGLMHYWIADVALGFRLGLWAGVLFPIHGGLVLLERKLKVSRWRRPLARVWTIGLVVLLSPMLIEPLLRIVALP